MHSVNRSTLIFRFYQQSRYSIAALLGAIETDPRLDSLNVLVPSEAPERSIQTWLKYGPVTVAYSVMSTQAGRIIEEAKNIRSKHGDRVTLIAGGPHASARPWELLEAGFDLVAIGEGERVFPEIMYRLGNGLDPTGVEGVVSECMEHYPKPHDLVKITLDDYPPFALGLNIVGPIEVTRGCPFACKFCCTPFLTGTVVRHRSVDSVVRWLSLAAQKRHFRRTWFLSPNALCYGGNGLTSRPEELESLLSKSASVDGIEEIFFGSFPSEVRPEFANHRILEILRQYTANKTLQIGLQSGSDRVLKIANRRHTVQQGRDAVGMALDAGFIPHVDMIFGLPGEEENDLKASLRLCDEMTGMGVRIHAHVFMPLPGSSFEQMPPGRLDEETRKYLGDLARRGLLTGSWGTQEQFGERLAAGNSDAGSD